MENQFSGGTCNFSLNVLILSFTSWSKKNCFFCRNQDGSEFNEFSDDEEMEEENEYYHNINNAETVEENHFVDNDFLGFEKEREESCSTDEEESIYSSVLDLESIYTDDEVEVKGIDDDSDSSCYSENNKVGPTSSLPRDLDKWINEHDR